MGSQREIQLFLAVAENFLAQRIGGKKTVAARVPIRRKARIGRMIQDCDGDTLVADFAAEIAPASPRAPSVIAFFSFTRQVGAVDTGIVQLSDGGGPAAGIGVDLGLVRGNLESADDTQSQDAILGIRKRNFFIECREGSYTVDAAEAGAAAEHEACVFLEQDFFVESDPSGFYFQLALLRAALGSDDRAVNYRSHLGSILGLDGVGIVPEIEAVDVFVVEPKAGVMRMIDAFTGALLQRKTARDDRGVGGAQRIEHRLSERGGPDVGSERLTVDSDVDTPLLLVDGNGDPVGGIGAGGDESCQERSASEQYKRGTGNQNAHD